MKLSISNIAWTQENESIVYKLMKKYHFSGLEIAPTRIFPESPYDKLEQGTFWSDELRRNHGFIISSMQSIWFGRQERIFGSEKERKELTAYTIKAVNFARAIQCNNLVFGCPKNRNVPDGVETDRAIPFFKELGDYAMQSGTVIGMEANPPIYHTNYINDTTSALNLIEAVNSKGFKLNLDTGTMIQNKESVDSLLGRVKYINHVHISEPELKPIEKRILHRELREILEKENYSGFISIEMGKVENLQKIESALKYVEEIFG